MTRSDFAQWLYRGQRPNWIARVLNRATAAVASPGIASDYVVTLEVTGRKSGRMISLPIAVVRRSNSKRFPSTSAHPS